MAELTRDGEALTPTAPLNPGETVKYSFHADRGTYLRDHAWMAAVAMAAGMAILWFIGNPYVWTGAVGGLAAVSVRGFYLASDDLRTRWDLTDQRLLGPQGRVIGLREIADVRAIGSAAQVITKAGDKHLVKYQADRSETRRRILAARKGLQ